MGVSSKPKTTSKTSTNQTENVNMTTTNTSAPNPAYAADIMAAKNAVTGAYGAAEKNNALQLKNVGGAQNYYNSVMGGKYLNGNPWLQNMIDLSGRDIRGAVGSEFELGNRYGSGMHVGVLARALGDMENQYRYGNYSAERANMGQAAQGAIQGATVAAALPQLASATYADQINALLGKYGTTTGTQTGTNTTVGTGTSTAKQSGGLLQSMLGAGAQAAGAYFSDRRLKRDIERIGDWDDKGDGLGRYRFSYTFDPARTILEGVMADEVKELRPQAYVPNFRGEYAGVNYGAL